ncbi:MAG: serine--tRNA ligase, partial [Elioraea tepidiphila]
MHDIRRIREAPEAFDAMLARRGLGALSAELLSLDRRRRAAQTAFQEMQAARNALSRRIGAARGKGEDASALQAEAASMAEAIAREEAEEKRLGAELDALLATIPNWLDDAVPTGTSEADNVVLRSWGERRSFPY